ncbi:hypothetical protein GCM10027610_040060 [Dactylosporangium cerinum]
MGGEVPDRGVADGEQRHGDEAADDPGGDDPRGDGEDDREGVQGDGAAHDERLQHVAFQLLDRDHDAQHDECGDGSLGDERDEDGDDTGQGGADDGDERAEEHQRREGQCERHAQDGEADADAGGVDERDEDGGPDVGHQGVPGVVPGPRGRHLGGAGQQPAEELPDLAAVAEEEEEGEQHDEEPGEDLAEGGGGAQRTRGEGALVLRHGLLQLLDAVAELGLGQVHRTLRQPGLHLVDALTHLGGELVELADERLHDQGETATDDHEPADQDGGGGEERCTPRVRSAAAAGSNSAASSNATTTGMTTTLSTPMSRSSR